MLDLHRCANRLFLFLPPANEVWGKVIFLHLFVILFTGEGGCLVLGGAWSGGSGPRGAWSGAGAWSGGDLVLGGMLKGRVWSRGVPAPRGPGGDSPDGYCCGRYASYWNAFLLYILVELLLS